MANAIVERLTSAPCCASCKHWSKHTVVSLGPAVGWCEVNYQHEMGGSRSRMQTLDLAVCSKWQAKEDTPDNAA
jgi:hypothetical protein